VAAAAHALKGSVGLFVRTGPYETARRLEHAGRSGALAGTADGYATLAGELAALRTVLADLQRER
jgi:hypothetical protein